MDKLHIPQQLKVGFNKREDTYNGYLGFITYLTNSTIFQEKAWRGWIRSGEARSQETFPILDIQNVPTSGFVLNKKVGGYRTEFGFRDSYTRVFDPRGFEFELTIPNLLFIIKHNGISKGGEFQGDMIYAWDGGQLYLLPIDSLEYENSKNRTEFLVGKIVVRDLVVGRNYISESEDSLTYLCKLEVFNMVSNTISSQEYDRDLQEYITPTISEHKSKSSKEILFYNSTTKNYVLLSNTKTLKATAEDSGLNCTVLISNYLDSNYIGTYEGHVFLPISETDYEEILNGKITEVFDNTDSLEVVKYTISNSYKKWGMDYKIINIHNPTKIMLTIDNKSYKTEAWYRYSNRDFKRLNFKTYTKEELLNSNLKIGYIKFGNKLKKLT